VPKVLLLCHLEVAPLASIWLWCPHELALEMPWWPRHWHCLLQEVLLWLPQMAWLVVRSLIQSGGRCQDQQDVQWCSFLQMDRQEAVPRVPISVWSLHQLAPEVPWWPHYWHYLLLEGLQWFLPMAELVLWPRHRPYGRRHCLHRQGLLLCHLLELVGPEPIREVLQSFPRMAQLAVWSQLQVADQEQPW
jgi:hypothetical protein